MVWLMYAQWSQNQWCISVSAGSFFPRFRDGRRGQALSPHLRSKTTRTTINTRFAQNIAWQTKHQNKQCRTNHKKKIISQNWCSQRKFSQLTQLVKASPSLMVVLEYKYGMILSFLFPSIIYSVLYTEVGHRSGSLGLFCGRRPRQAVHKLPMLLLP